MVLIAISLGIVSVYMQDPIRYLFSLLPRFPEYHGGESRTILREFNIWSIPRIITGAIIAPIIEELFYRGFILEKLLNIYKVSLAIFFSAILFGFSHFDSVSPSFGSLTTVFITFLGAIFTGILYFKTRKIVYPIILHITWNLIIYISHYVNFPML